MKSVTKNKSVGVWKENFKPTIKGEDAADVLTKMFLSPMVWAISFF